MMIPRTYAPLEALIRKGKVLVLYGPRRVGKSTVLIEFLKRTRLRYVSVVGDDVSIQEIFSSQRLEKIAAFAKEYALVVIDEAQRIPNIGGGLKLLVDHRPDLFVIATGSASFDLRTKLGEPLAGRKITRILYPIAQRELRSFSTPYELHQQLHDRLIYGSYPEVITAETATEKQSVLSEIINSYLLKDILELERVKGSKALLDLLRLLSFQVGNEVSHTELGNALGMDKNTIARYLDLFEKVFIIYNLRGFFRNMRTSITKKSKYFFWDTGIRNALIQNTNTLSLRNDVGQLWKNFLVIERLKTQEYLPLGANNYFWRSWSGKEIDWIEEREGKLFTYEFKWSKEKNPMMPKEFHGIYPDASFFIINPENYLDFVA